MWVISITIPYNKSSFFGFIAKKNNITIFGYPHSHTLYSNHIRILTSGFVIGTEKNIKQTIKDLKKDNRLLNIEINKNHLILDVKQHLMNKELFQPGLLFIKPGITTNKGEYIFEIGSWKREQLINIYKAYKIENVKLNWIKKKKISGIQITTPTPNLTEKQKQAFKLAVEKGYYGYPRKIDIIQLSKEFNCSHSTFQFHLRNAEKKLMPTLL
ncbi:MAG: helix-turn-helix domain-containing protein [Candidatus Woesearchaeota archaeon]|jgi:predicted DNA binding protein